MSDILVAAEIRSLLDNGALAPHTIHWLDPANPVPAGDFAALLPLLTRPIGPAELDRLPKLRIVANCGAGVDNLDLDAIAARGIPATNTPDVLTESTADFTWALILAAARRMKEGHRLLEAGEWRGWDPTQLLGMELAGRTLGIVGAGRIGQAVARRAPGFGMSILYYARTRRPEFEADCGATWADLETLLAESDVVSIHVPLSEETRGMFDAARLRAMRPGAILVNTARGGIVNETALLESVDGGRLAGAGLDVFDGEPSVHPRLVDHPRIVCMPHLGSATRDTRRGMANLAAENVVRVLRGEAPLTPVAR